MRARILAAAAAALSLAGAAAAQNPSMSDDYKHMMQWLTEGVSDGLAFNAGSTFDPPTELKPWHVQPDVSFGVGNFPLDKSNFPKVAVQQLADMHPEKLLPDSVMFPNLTLHARMGLENRWDLSVRGVNMTVPNGYKLTPGTTGEGQSNTLGFSVRKHFYGGDLPLLSVSGNFNHVFGHFNFYNEFKNLELIPGSFVDSKNHGKMEWSVNSIGVNTVASQSYGVWTPFAGFGLNRMSGSVRGRMESVFNDALIIPVVGEASSTPEEFQGRFIFGTQMDRSRLSMFFNGEVKLLGKSAYRSFVMSVGVVAPFRIGWGATAGRDGDRDRKDRLASRPTEREEYLDAPRSAPGRKAYAPHREPWDGGEPEPLKASGWRSFFGIGEGRPPAARLEDAAPRRPARVSDSPRPRERTLEPWEDASTGSELEAPARRRGNFRGSADGDDGDAPRTRVAASAAGARRATRGEEYERAPEGPGVAENVKSTVLRWWRNFDSQPGAASDAGYGERPISSGKRRRAELPDAVLIK
ncbi:MAG: hypothetical protein HY078_11020 [Elusimicrobia bacterium]|nr:hypothetical protein [Elusimicrobiota bacterium]